ncbi:DUF6115 domain-containing protein [Pseudobutyrivibrio sp.]|uniref:DUF6115 domain-containing protein n=1 Tax=Pseudobutyrivibrio sp. TaxID=2014367 RepID=UPI001B6361B4|nr:hypothetical protein [Pseudobutyrivibrio sp.]MBP3261052.1 hypothetical protein [Pseudobutyrivibrio sp.]
MRKLIFYCDRCKKKIEGDAHRLSDYIIDTDRQLKKEGYSPKELCEDCSRVVNFMASNAVGMNDTDSPCFHEIEQGEQVTGKLENAGNKQPKENSEAKKQLESKLAEKKESPNEPSTEPKIEPKKKKVDEDKVMALIAQGRSQVSVARELGITQPQVSMIVNKYK